MDNFEKQLASQPMRPIPAHWKNEIIQAARPAAEPSFFRELFINLRWGWGGLATIWLFLIGINLQSGQELNAAGNSAQTGDAVQRIAEMRKDLNQMLAYEKPQPPPAYLRPRSHNISEEKTYLIIHA